MLSRRTLLAAGMLAMGIAPAAMAASYPDHLVRLVVPFTPGGGADLLARYIAAELSKSGGNFVVENIAGAAGSVGSAMVAKAPADGYTLLLGTVSTLILNELLQPKPQFTLEKFDIVTETSQIQTLVVVSSQLGVSSMSAFLDKAKAEPGKLNFGSAGVNSSAHLTAELFQKKAGIELFHIPYKGGADAWTALAAGDIQVLFSSVAEAAPWIQSGRAVPLAVMTPDHVTLYPNVPTLTEVGIKDSDVPSWHAVVAPKGTPPEVLNWLDMRINAILRSNDGQKALARFGLVPVSSTRESFGARILQERAMWREVIKETAADTPK